MAVPEGIVELFFEALEEGASIYMAQRMIRVSDNWCKRRCEADPEFEAKVKEAQTKSYKAALVAFKGGFDSDWRAAESWLKRKHKDEFGDVQTVEVTSKDVDPLDGYTDEEILKLKEIERAKDERKQSEGKV